jgi:hypothetical protein
MLQLNRLVTVVVIVIPALLACGGEYSALSPSN